MICTACQATNDDDAEECFTCGKALHALTQGSILNGRYEVRRPLGRGGMGRVYEAFDHVLEETVAIKVLRAELIGDPAAARRLRSEIKLARKVSHRNVCRIHEYGEDLGVAYISMEFIAGSNLKESLRERTPLHAEAFELAYQLCAGLAAIHEHGIVHRDFKTANIMLDTRGVAKIMDFGIAKHVESETGAGTLSGLVLGTPEYMSPEQVQGRRLDFRSDVYALGCVVYEIFTGAAPFRGETPYATLLKQLNEPPPLADAAARGLPAALLPVVDTALAKDAQNRYATVGGLAAALREAQAALPADPAPASGVTFRPRPTAKLSVEEHPQLAAPPPPPAARPRRPRNSDTITLLGMMSGGRSARDTGAERRWLWAGAAVPVLAVVVIAGLRSSGPAPSPPSASPIATSPASTSVAAPLAAPTPMPATPKPAVGSAPRQRQRDHVADAIAPQPAPTAPTPAATPIPLTASVAPPVPSPVPQTQAPPSAAPLQTGTLALTVVPEAEVVLDDTSLGTLTRRDITLEAGTHALRVLHADYEPLPRRFTIRPGETLALLLDLQEKGIPKRPR
jgi:serine/threonine-protein kinase